MRKVHHHVYLMNNQPTKPMTYEESFLSTCDAEGNAPDWAFSQIFEEHGSSIDEYTDSTPEANWLNGETILDWLGY